MAKKKSPKKKKASRKPKATSPLSPRSCFQFGHELMRLQCGIAYALNELKDTGIRKDRLASSENLRVAMTTVNKYALAAGKMIPSVRRQAKELAMRASVLSRSITGATVSGGRAATVEKQVRGMLTLSAGLEEKGKSSCER